jgi:hypothetical protein
LIFVIVKYLDHLHVIEAFLLGFEVLNEYHLFEHEVVVKHGNVLGFELEIIRPVDLIMHLEDVHFISLISDRAPILVDERWVLA